MTLNVKIEKEGAKTTPRILSEFSRAMFSTGIVRHLKMNKRYFSRKPSPLRKKQDKLRKIAKLQQREQDIKDGKIILDSRGRIVKK